MGLIYSLALATLVAPAAEDANSGLPGVRSNSRLPLQATERVAGHVLGTEPPEFLYSLWKSKYQTRGWTLQEELLSQRCLYFTDHQMYLFDDATMYSDLSGQITGTALEQARHLNYLRTKSWLEGGVLNEELAPWEVAFRIYARLVGDFTKRQLSHQTDGLNAVAGILSTLQSRLGGAFLCGLPEAHVDYALLWAPEKSLTRNFNFPSWSWAGWVGQSAYTQKPVYLGLSHAPVRLRSEPEDLSTSQHSPIRNVGGSDRRPWAADPPLYRNITVMSFSALAVNARFFFFGSPAPSISMLQPEATSAIIMSAGSQPARCGVLFHQPGTLTLELSEAFEYGFVLLSRCCEGRVNPEFHYDEKLFPDRPWSVLNVMLISRLRGLGDAERMAIGQMHEDAWDLACPKWEKIWLY